MTPRRTSGDSSRGVSSRSSGDGDRVRMAIARSPIPGAPLAFDPAAERGADAGQAPVEPGTSRGWTGSHRPRRGRLGRRDSTCLSSVPALVLARPRRRDGSEADSSSVGPVPRPRVIHDARHGVPVAGAGEDPLPATGLGRDGDPGERAHLDVGEAVEGLDRGRDPPWRWGAGAEPGRVHVRRVPLELAPGRLQARCRHLMDGRSEPCVLAPTLRTSDRGAQKNMSAVST